MQLFHGAHTQFNLHLGQCFCREEEVARVYATSRGTVTEINLDLSDLTVVEVEGYDRDADYSIGDKGSEIVNADVIEFIDEDARGTQHRTWRLMSPKALAAVVVVDATDDE